MFRLLPVVVGDEVGDEVVLVVVRDEVGDKVGDEVVLVIGDEVVKLPYSTLL
jgi:hypothetical protein